jgi:prepilin-type N-terminal cleavage/methylation domain-containing protein/prepilin-type processing-associated H-X9-DG protein
MMKAPGQQELAKTTANPLVRPLLRADRTSGFTLVETLVVVAILALLLSILVPAMKSARDQMKTLMCASKMKTIALKFYFFTEGENPGGRGQSESLNRNEFWMDDFQASLYQIEGFWSAPDTSVDTMDVGDDLMMCPAGPRELVRTKDKPFGTAAVGPAENVSIGFNGRLYRAVVRSPSGEYVLAPKKKTRVTNRILNHPNVPLAFDIDGMEANRQGVDPYYSAPPSRQYSSNDPYSENHWVPSGRHRGGTNVAFVGGHIQSSKNPGQEPWDWDYQAQVAR